TSKAAGDYTVNISDADGCSFNVPVRIEEKPGPRVIVSADNVGCVGETTGRLRSYVSGGSAPYTYAWNNGGSMEVLENLAPGGYGLTITDADGCTAQATAVVAEPAALMATAEAIGPDNGTDNGVAAVSMVSGGTHPYTYEWQTTPVQTGAEATGLSAGNVDVIIRDYNGCETTQTVEIASNVGIEDLQAAGISALQAFPNPSRGAFTLDIQLAQADQMNLSIYDMTGKVLYKHVTDRTLSFNTNIDLGNVAAGMYTLRVETSQGVGYQRLSVE
ncbi:MAG: T9SS type A sorting domain-containing protein, partial [Bacteroidota bacterium]